MKRLIFNEDHDMVKPLLGYGSAMNYINPIVRYLSGAKMTNQEAMRYYQALVPVPGESIEMVLLKRRKRRILMDAMGGEDINAGPAGSFDCSITSPDDREFCEGYTLANWNDREDGLEISWIIPCPSIVGEWNIKVSGSGMEGLPGIAYSGAYEIKVKSEILVSG